MRLAVISDIHGNLEAFNRVSADIESSNVDEIICLGDNIGYGPDSEAVVRKIREYRIPSVLGNHELAVADPAYLEWLNPLARRSLEMTAASLSSETIQYVIGLEKSLVSNGCRYVHGFPPDSVRTYLFQVRGRQLMAAFEQITETRCFIGHTHLLKLIGYDGNRVFRSPLCKGITQLDKDKKYIINFGSVGQPRDGDNTAKYVIWDSGDDHLELKFIPYDIAAVANKILAAGLPQAHARRLW